MWETNKQESRMLQPRMKIRCWAFTTVLLATNAGNFLYAGKPGGIEEWQEIKPGGSTSCARGADFSFFYRPGTSQNVIVDFMGGGACWDGKTCDKTTATFTDTVDYVRDVYRTGVEGIYDHSINENPVKNWHHVVIPYCTGDLHWGNNEVTYTDTAGANFTIKHRGAENVNAVLAWVTKKFAQPKKLLVTGCSAGSYASIYWTPKIKEIYKHSKVMQLGDAGAGVITADFSREAFPLWQPQLSAPSWIPELDPATHDWNTLSIPEFYEKTSAYYAGKGVEFAQYNSAFDATQTFFYELMGGQPVDWSQQMMGSVRKILETTPNFHSYVAAGEDHCIIPYKRFYTMETQGVKFRDWFKNFIEGKKPAPVTCKDCWVDSVDAF
jgi:hypothetical protein